MRALTGIDTDRLEEEKRRGISIDLGFAQFDLGDVQISFVDVPGHERFIRNMLAGVGGIDLVLLVVSAEEGIKPQTREHFQICRLLGIAKGVIALTKSDLASEERQGEVIESICEMVRGTFLETAPVVAVSATTRVGLDTLTQELLQAASALPERNGSGIFRLPIDRSFVLKGFGTVVTGTLWNGQLNGEDEVELQPSRKRLRVRGIQVHGGPVPAAHAGQRTAANLAGIDASEIRRGMVLTAPGWLEASTAVDCSFELLPGASALPHRASVHFHAGTAEIEAEVRLLEGLDPVQPGTHTKLRLLLREPALVLPGDRFVLRNLSPVQTLGGGTVIDNHPPVRIKRLLAAARVEALENADLAGRVRYLLNRAANGLALRQLVAATGALPQTVAEVAQKQGARLLQGTEPWLVSQNALQDAALDLKEKLAQFHQQNPMLPGMAKAMTRLDPRILSLVLSITPEVLSEQDSLRLASHRPELKADEDAALARIEKLFREAGLAVPALNEALAGSGVDDRRARTLLQLLLRQRRLVRITADLIFHADVIVQLRARIGARKGTAFSVGEFKEWTGVSRKYAIPLLEYLDREKVTRREGDSRVVL